MLTSKGVTAWRRALARLTCASTSTITRPPAPAARPPAPAARPPVPLPGPVTTELIHALAGLAVALAGT